LAWVQGDGQIQGNSKQRVLMRSGFAIVQ
jgi:hypothetical protein